MIGFLRNWVFAVALPLAFAGCSALPPRSATSEEHAIHSDRLGYLDQVAAASMAPGFPSAFQLMPVASADYETRIALTNRAERSIDIQSFVFNVDDTGGYWLKELRAAALRGVRVRLLIDDLNSSGNDAALVAFSNVPNVEVRLFNPFVLGRSSFGTRIALSLNELGRINHRMHNKLFVADNVVAVFGGRNVADEYFMRAKAANFVDFDVLAVGKVVDDLSGTFDDYWNSALSYPIKSIVASASIDHEPDSPETNHQPAAPRADGTVPTRLERYAHGRAELEAGRFTMVGADATVVVDPVDKAFGTRVRDRRGTVRAYVASVMRSAHDEVFVVSPYFVPGDLGMEAIRTLNAQHVKLELLTNSLASTDEPSVHGGYLRYRAEMLDLGVEIYELSPTLARRAAALGRFEDSLGMLHAKIIVIDRKRLFVGSMNMDERSARYNTELGVLIDSPDLTNDLLGLMHFQGSAYRVRRNASTGHLEWVAEVGYGEEIQTEEPEAGWWLRFKAWLLGNLLPEGWL